jgi:hypothetical protein
MREEFRYPKQLHDCRPVGRRRTTTRTRTRTRRSRPPLKRQLDE